MDADAHDLFVVFLCPANQVCVLLFDDFNDRGIRGAVGIGAFAGINPT